MLILLKSKMTFLRKFSSPLIRFMHENKIQQRLRMIVSTVLPNSKGLRPLEIE